VNDWKPATVTGRGEPGAGRPWEPVKVKAGVTLRNRFVVAPMTTDSSHPDGTATESELSYIGRRAANEFAIGITSCAYVDVAGRAWQGIGAAGQAHLRSLRAVAEAFQSSGGLAMLQLYDAGRLADPRLVPAADIRAPSAVASSRPGALTPRAMSTGEVHELVEAFGRAAALGLRAGFDGVEIHGANHYAVHQFFSPRSNARTDDWGGSSTERMRFPLAVTAAVREALGQQQLLGYRVSPFENETGGYTLDDSVELCVRVRDLGADYIHISMDDFRRNSPMPEDRDWTSGVQTGRHGISPIGAIKDAVGPDCSVIASGGIKSLEDAHAALEAGADLIAVGRAVLIDPEWLTKLKDGRPSEVRHEIPSEGGRIGSTLTIPDRMVQYLLSRPGWIPRESATR